MKVLDWDDLAGRWLIITAEPDGRNIGLFDTQTEAHEWAMAHRLSLCG